MLNCEVVLELLDADGVDARYTRTERVRFLEPAVTITDYGWGNGIAFAEHEVSAGRFRDRKLVGTRLRSTVTLATPHDVNDKLTFSVDRLIKNGFVQESEWWLEAEIQHRVQRLSLEVRLPAGREVAAARLTRKLQPEAHMLHVRKDEQGMQHITVEVIQPPLGERFKVNWLW